MKKLTATTITALMFMTTELVGGTISNSLAVLTDAAHQFSDVAGFVFSIIAIYTVRYPQYFGKTFGNARADTIGALVTVLIIWLLLIGLMYEAILRIRNIENV